MDMERMERAAKSKLRREIGAGRQCSLGDLRQWLIGRFPEATDVALDRALDEVRRALTSGRFMRF